ncbi:MAG: chemotaxis protein CheD [Deltaproteobacteria bacterium]|nr:MAG: chemotaxis protein CheD [Deltaproteobacteria bacterium]
MKVIVGIADMRVTNEPGVTLVTYSLGSCIGVTLYDPAARVGGIFHFMLPDSRIDSQKAQKNPWMFADTGIPLFFKEAYKLGGEKRRMQVKIAGGSQILDESGYFNIGKRNYTMLRKIFWMNGVLIQAEEIGGNVNRTLSLEVSSGKVWVKTSGNGVKEI